MERKVEILERAYDLLVDEAGFAPEDIVVDPNILAVATGIEEHDLFAKAFIDLVPRLLERCPRHGVGRRLQPLLCLPWQ